MPFLVQIEEAIEAQRGAIEVSSALHSKYDTMWHKYDTAQVWHKYGTGVAHTDAWTRLSVPSQLSTTIGDIELQVHEPTAI